MDICKYILRKISCFDINFLYYYNCKHLFRPTRTHQYSQRVKKSLKLNDFVLHDVDVRIIP